MHPVVAAVDSEKREEPSERVIPRQLEQRKPLMDPQIRRKFYAPDKQPDGYHRTVN